MKWACNDDATVLYRAAAFSGTGGKGFGERRVESRFHSILRSYVESGVLALPACCMSLARLFFLVTNTNYKLHFLDFIRLCKSLSGRGGSNGGRSAG